ncbi:MAG: radical SAM protein [Clostridiales bacterium]|nr:radical SAM protein [Clostridiales bacterium]
MYIKLIQPRMIKRPMDTDLKTRMSPPLGLLTVMNILRDKHRVRLENENIRPVEFFDGPDLVGISVTVDTLPRAMEIAREFRKRGIPVVAGGIHITTAPDTIPADAFDALCIGPAEGTWPRIVEDAAQGKLHAVYRCERPLTGADIVSPAYDLISPQDYLYCNIVHTSRGCPFRCDFCYNSCGNHAYLKRPIEDVLRDIHTVGRRHIMFIDDNFAGDPAWTRQLLHAITPLRIRWNAAVSLNAALDCDLLDLMKRSGCEGLFIGFESVNEASISAVHKGQNCMAKYEQAVRNIHDRGMMVNASFVFGLDGDTPDTFRRTLDWIYRNRIETVTSHIMTPYPGTRLYEQLKDEGRITSDDLSLYNTANVVFAPRQMTAKQLRDGYLWIYKQVYSFRGILRRMPQKPDQRAAYLMFNLLYRKFGRFSDALCRLIGYGRIGYLGEKLARYLGER